MKEKLVNVTDSVLAADGESATFVVKHRDFLASLYFLIFKRPMMLRRIQGTCKVITELIFIYHQTIPRLDKFYDNRKDSSFQILHKP